MVEASDRNTMEGHHYRKSREYLASGDFDKIHEHFHKLQDNELKETFYFDLFSANYSDIDKKKIEHFRDTLHELNLPSEIVAAVRGRLNIELGTSRIAALDFRDAIKNGYQNSMLWKYFGRAINEMKLDGDSEQALNLVEEVFDYIDTPSPLESITQKKIDEYQTLLEEKEKKHREDMQGLLSRIQKAETEKERLAMEMEQIRNMGAAATATLERTGLDYQAYITLRDKFILDEVARLAASPLSRILSTRELDNAITDILKDLELTFHTVTAVRKKKSQMKDFYRKPRIEDLTIVLNEQLREIPEFSDDPSMRASIIEVGLGRPFYNSLIESVILDSSPPGTRLKIRKPNRKTIEYVTKALELDVVVRYAEQNPSRMITALPNLEEDKFFDLFYLLDKESKALVKSNLLEAYTSFRQQALTIPIRNLKLWYTGFYVEPERLDEIREIREGIEEDTTLLSEHEPETVTIVTEQYEEEEGLAECGNCGAKIPGSAMECPECGIAFEEE